MGDIVSTQENLAEHPKTIATYPDGIGNTALAIGDLHGNTMKLIYFLIQSGVMALKNAAQYGELLAIYNKKTDQLAKDDLNTFISILNSTTITKPGLLTLIGDEVGDRGENDWLTLLVLNRLHDATVPYQILGSNHGSVALDSFANRKEMPKVIAYTEKDQQVSQQTSLDNLWILVNRGAITKKNVVDLVNKVYKPHVILIGYTQAAKQELTIYTHAPAGLKIIQELAEKFDVPYDDSTEDTLKSCIDAINKKASSSIINNQFTDFYDVRRTSQYDPLYQLFWARALRYDESLTPSTHAFSVQCVHGHLGEWKDMGTGYHNIDSNIGKGSTLNQGALPVWSEKMTANFKSSYVPPAERTGTAQYGRAVDELIWYCKNYIKWYKHPDDAKKEIITHALNALQAEGKLQADRLIAFDEILSTPANIKTLTQRRDTALSTFLKAVLVVLASVPLFLGTSYAYRHLFGDKATHGHEFLSCASQKKYKDVIQEIRTRKEAAATDKPEESHNASTNRQTNPGPS